MSINDQQVLPAFVRQRQGAFKAIGHPLLPPENIFSGQADRKPCQQLTRDIKKQRGAQPPKTVTSGAHPIVHKVCQVKLDQQNAEEHSARITIRVKCQNLPHHEQPWPIRERDLLDALDHAGLRRARQQLRIGKGLANLGCHAGGSYFSGSRVHHLHALVDVRVGTLKAIKIALHGLLNAKVSPLQLLGKHLVFRNQQHVAAPLVKGGLYGITLLPSRQFEQPRGLHETLMTSPVQSEPGQPEIPQQGQTPQGNQEQRAKMLRDAYRKRQGLHTAPD